MMNHNFLSIGCYILSFTIIVFSGCSSTCLVSQSNSKGNSDILDFPSVNKQIRNYTVRITLIDSTEYTVPQFQIGKDSSLITVTPGQGFLIPNHSIAYLRIVNHTKGAVVGLMLGAVGGLVVGGILAPKSGNSDSSSDGLAQGFIIVGATALGLTTGVVWGAIKGNQTFYEMK
jgi:hypothetical protein